MSLMRWVRNQPLVRWLFHRVFVTGDNVRLCLQQPVLRRLMPAQVRVALDAGAGSGEYTRSLLLPVARYTVALDITGEGLRRLASRLSPAQEQACGLLQGSVEQLPFSDGVFDLVLCTEVLEHCPDDGKAVGELARVLAPEGLLLISVPVPPPAIEDPAHIREGYTAEQLTALLGAHGLECREVIPCMFGLTRRALRLASWFHHRLRIPPPLMLMCHVERWLGARAPGREQPFDLVVGATRTRD